MRINGSYEPVHSVLVQYHQYTIYKNTKKFNMWAYENEFLKYYGNRLYLLRELYVDGFFSIMSSLLNFQINLLNWKQY